MSRLTTLRDRGQSFWLDSLSRQMLEDGSLAERVRRQGLTGVTSNPSIFRKAISESPFYEAPIRASLETMDGAEEVYTALAVADVSDACDLLLPVYRETDGADGFVSLEVSPHLAYDPLGTIDEARTLWKAVANARLAYGRLREFLASERWRRLADRGAHTQRLVWASTGTKDPSYSDLMYVEPLIGPDTVSTMPEATAAAFEDHGRVAATLTQDQHPAAEVMEGLERLGIDLDVVTAALVSEGVQTFIDAFDGLLACLEERCAKARRSIPEQPLAGVAARPR